MRAAFLFMLALAGPALAQAVDAPAQPGLVRLSPAEREAAIEAGAVRSERELPINGLGRGVHGEIGTEFGSHGERALYGAASVPLGETGAASFSFLTSRADWPRR